MGRGYGRIEIGQSVWLGNSCKVNKDVVVPPFSVVGADTILHKTITTKEYSLICNDRTSSVKHSGVFREPANDKIIYD